jgi:S-adenosylmethionine/arginine decarboxylase-like enzyme
MKDLAPGIVRQRLLLEGYYGIEVEEEEIRTYFKGITDKLGLRMYGEPIIFSPQSLGSYDNQGYDAFVPLIDSGISLYVWKNHRFISVVVYTCKRFDPEAAIAYTRAFFDIKESASHSF